MTENIFIAYLTQLLAQSPVVLVYVVGLVLALVYYHRCPRPATFTFIGTGLLLVTTLVHSFLFLYLVRVRDDFGWSHTQVGWMLAEALMQAILDAPVTACGGSAR